MGEDKAGSRAQLWIGVAELKPLDAKTYEAAGAFTNIVTWACDVAGFHLKAQTIAATLDMFVANVEEVEPVADEIEDMVFRAESNPNAIVYGSFHRYPFNEA